MMITIDRAETKEVFDSRGRPTIEVMLVSGEHMVQASVPSGKSTGSKEALEKRDKDGRGVEDVLHLLREEVFPQLLARTFENQRALDDFLIELDGTPNKSRLGANGILAVSIAFAKLSAAKNKLPVWKFIAKSEGFTAGFPRLYMNVLNGGAHADFKLPFQEYIVVAGGLDSVRETYARAKKLFSKLGEIVREETVEEVPFGDEGGYAPKLATLDRPFEILADLIDSEPTFFLGIDAAATEFLNKEGYRLIGTNYPREALNEVYGDLMSRFPLRSIEDPFAEDDPQAFAKLLADAPEGTLVVGDDLTVTNPKVIAEMIVLHAGNALIIKPNQVGSLSEVYDTIRLAHQAGWKTVVSHRSGETDDSFIADLAVGVGAYGLKAGAPSQQVRAVKYERLVQIEAEYANVLQ